MRVTYRSTFKETINELIEDNISKLSNIITNCSSSDKYNSSLSILKHEPTLKNSILKELEKAVRNISKSINDFEQNFDINYIQSSDPILEEFVKIINNKISKEITEEEKSKLYIDGENRYKNNIPPGYKDNDKPSPEKFGDLIIWNELQEISKNNKKPILFISHDRKEDWAIKFKGYDLGPRKELIKEFLNNTNNLFYSITTTKFIQIISDSYKITNIKKLQEETENIQKNIQQKEFEKRKAKREEYLEMYQNINNNPLETYGNTQELFNKINNSPLDQINRTRELLDRMNNNPIDQINRTRELLDRINNNPMEQINKTRELLGGINTNPLEEYYKNIDVRTKKDKND